MLRRKLCWATILLMLAGTLARAAAHSTDKAKDTQFFYVAGTEALPEGCPGVIEVANLTLGFTCHGGSLEIPYAKIRLMQYRSDVSRSVRKLKVKWTVAPPPGGGKENRYFVVVYEQDGKNHAVVFKVKPLEMRPYLAEIDLKSGKRVEVQRYEEYE